MQEVTLKEEIILKRTCEAIAIPSGIRENLLAGTTVLLLQARGGSYTVSAQNRALYRIDGANADALGLEVPAAHNLQQPVAFSEQLVWDALRTVYDPEIPVNIVDLRLVYSCEIVAHESGKSINIRMAMTAPGCGMSNVLKADVETKLQRLPEVVEVQVEVVFDPPWNPSRMSDAARLQLGLDLEQSSTSKLTQIS
jgi:probable FeS assembly SUF system protein SufT